MLRHRHLAATAERSPPSIEKFSRIQNTVRVESALDRAMELARDVARCLRPPTFLGQPDSMLARDDTAPRQHLLKQIVERVFDLFTDRCVAVVTVGHDIDVNVP